VVHSRLTSSLFPPARGELKAGATAQHEVATTFAVGEEAEAKVTPGTGGEAVPVTAPLDRVQARGPSGFDTVRVDVRSFVPAPSDHISLDGDGTIYDYIYAHGITRRTTGLTAVQRRSHGHGLASRAGRDFGFGFLADRKRRRNFHVCAVRTGLQFAARRGKSEDVNRECTTRQKVLRDFQLLRVFIGGGKRRCLLPGSDGVKPCRQRSQNPSTALAACDNQRTGCGFAG